MRLLNTSTLQLKDFPNNRAVEYAILSHTWGEEEVSFSDLEHPQVQGRAGFQKILRFCAESKSQGLTYGWVDTCCIDKTSSSELSEAINSMFRWYEDARVCIAYLVDVAPAQGNDEHLAPGSAFRRSRWFRRGWTLQELLAPEVTIFMDQEWNQIGTKRDLQPILTTITGIPAEVLAPDNTLRKEAADLAVSVAQKMSWASNRETSRGEDTAYCLLGVFGISMPLLYGEGSYRAFLRLQLMIVEQLNDESLFAWKKDRYGEYDLHDGLLASSPIAFQECGDIVQYSFDSARPPYSMTNRGLRLDVLVNPNPSNFIPGIHLLPLNCCKPVSPTRIMVIPLVRVYKDQFDRARELDLVEMEEDDDAISESMLEEEVLYVRQSRNETLLAKF